MLSTLFNWPTFTQLFQVRTGPRERTFRDGSSRFFYGPVSLPPCQPTNSNNQTENRNTDHFSVVQNFQGHKTLQNIRGRAPHPFGSLPLSPLPFLPPTRYFSRPFFLCTTSVAKRLKPVKSAPPAKSGLKPPPKPNLVHFKSTTNVPHPLIH